MRVKTPGAPPLLRFNGDTPVDFASNPRPAFRFRLHTSLPTHTFALTQTNHLPHRHLHLHRLPIQLLKLIKRFPSSHTPTNILHTLMHL